MAKGDYAGRILVHYFRLVAREAGVKLDYENDMEIRAAVDDIVEAAVQRAVEKCAERCAAKAEAKQNESIARTASGC